MSLVRQKNTMPIIRSNRRFQCCYIRSLERFEADSV